MKQLDSPSITEDKGSCGGQVNSPDALATEEKKEENGKVPTYKLAIYNK